MGLLWLRGLTFNFQDNHFKTCTIHTGDNHRKGGLHQGGGEGKGRGGCRSLRIPIIYGEMCGLNIFILLSRSENRNKIFCFYVYVKDNNV